VIVFQQCLLNYTMASQQKILMTIVTHGFSGFQKLKQTKNTIFFKKDTS
jgi:hypothetical protein